MNYTFAGSLLQVLKGFRVAKDPDTLVDLILQANVPEDADEADMAAYGMLITAQLQSRYLLDSSTLNALAQAMSQRIRDEQSISQLLYHELIQLFIVAKHSRMNVRVQLHQHALYIVNMRIN
jgi:hypothetical protein